MKKFILLSVFVFLCIAGFSQVIFGVKGGLNLATFTGNDVEDAKFHPSFHVGGLVNFMISDKITLQPEVLYSGKGAKSDSRTYNLGYVTVPVFVQYNTPSGFFIEAGPQVGFLVSAKQKISGGGTLDFKDQVKSTDFSWVGGLGYKTLSGFGAGARYDFGFYNIANQGIIRNKAIMISLFYTFHTGEE